MTRTVIIVLGLTNIVTLGLWRVHYLLAREYVTKSERDFNTTINYLEGRWENLRDIVKHAQEIGSAGDTEASAGWYNAANYITDALGELDGTRRRKYGNRDPDISRTESEDLDNR